MAVPYFAFVSDSTGATVELDITDDVEELVVVHNDVDADGSGRDTKTGEMKRKRIAKKHTLTVKMLRVSGARVHKIYHQLSGHQSFYVKYLHPCANDLRTFKFYCSSINYGAQRYDESDKTTYYHGMSFNIIEI